jgi:ATP synthase protein I
MSPEDREAFRKRSAELGRRLEEVQHRKDGPAPGAGTARGEAMGRALRVSAELIGGIVTGAAIGWFLDKWLGLEKPWFFVLFFFIGAAAGMLNVIRTAMREKTPPLPSVPDDEDEDR